MWKDGIIEEIRIIREEHARKHHYNIKEIFSSLKEEERKSGREIFSFHPKRFSSCGTSENQDSLRIGCTQQKNARNT